MRKSNESNQSNESNDILKNRDFRRSPEGWLLSFVGIGTCLHFYVLAALSSTYFSPLAEACIAECGPQPENWGVRLRTRTLGELGNWFPLLCPDWYVAGLMTGSGWFDSAHGLQVYHFYPFTPLALRLGVVFYFLDVMPMFCPYPTTCEYDDYWKTGVHYCAAGRCQYIMTAKVMLERERARLAREKYLTERQKQKLEEIREQLRKLNAQFWEESERGV